MARLRSLERRNMMPIIIALTVGFGCFGLFLLLASRQSWLAQRLAGLESDLASLREMRQSALPSEVANKPKTLEGLRIALHIAQDHPHAVFANLLREQLLKEDVADVSFLPVEDGVSVLAGWRSSAVKADILIDGGLTCNGYAEVYYQAEFTCYTPNEAVCTIIERPPGGDRPGNLAMELVTKLSTTLEDLVRRNERRQAIGELHGS